MPRAPVRVLVVVVALFALGVGPGGGEAAGFTRPRITWTVGAITPSTSGSECNLRVICFDVKPGEGAVADVTFESSADVIAPRLIMQSPNGTRVMRMESTILPAVLSLGSPVTAQIVIEAPPGFRAERASGRLYIGDRGSVLVPQLDIRVHVLHPTPVQIQLTPVVIPTNHVRLLADRFNIRELTVISGTTVTWTNKDVRPHAVLGTLCDASFPFDRGTQCPFDPATVGATCNTPDAVSQQVLCINSGQLNPEVPFSFKIRRPNSRQVVRYYMEDGLGVSDNMKGYLVVK